MESRRLLEASGDVHEPVWDDLQDAESFMGLGHALKRKHKVEKAQSFTQLKSTKSMFLKK